MFAPSNISLGWFAICALLLAGSSLGLAVGASDPARSQGVSASTLTNTPLGQYAIPDTLLRMTAWTFVAPVDWSRAGGMYWTGQLLPLAYYSELKVSSPTGKEQLELFPTAIFVATDDPRWTGGRPSCRFLSAEECVREILIPKFRPLAQHVRVIEIDREARQLREEAAARARTQGAAGYEIRAARVLVEYNEQGQLTREMYFCTLMGSRPIQSPTVWCVERALALRAPSARFEQSYRLLGLMASSLRENQAWVLARGRQLRAMIPPPTTRSAGSGPSILDVSKSISRNNDQFLKNIDAINTQRLSTPASDGWTRAFRNTDRMTNPSTGEEMDVTGGYLQYYQDYSGRIYGSNDPSDFYLQIKIGGTVLEPAP